MLRVMCAHHLNSVAATSIDRWRSLATGWTTCAATTQDDNDDVDSKCSDSRMSRVQTPTCQLYLDL